MTWKFLVPGKATDAGLYNDYDWRKHILSLKNQDFLSLNLAAGCILSLSRSWKHTSMTNWFLACGSRHSDTKAWDATYTLER
jgi:hypothetical protein